jgi:hypothetical protein
VHDEVWSVGSEILSHRFPQGQRIATEADGSVMIVVFAPFTIFHKFSPLRSLACGELAGEFLSALPFRHQTLRISSQGLFQVLIALILCK